MKAEKIILSFVAVFVGLLAAGIAFYLYQATQTVPTEQAKQETPQNTTAQQPTPVTSDNNVFTIDEPKNETVSSNKVIPIKGKAVPGSVITISTSESDKVIKPAENGEFSLTQSIADGTSIIQISAIFPDGTEKKEVRTVTYSTEDF